jgi:hypothetical protein
MTKGEGKGSIETVESNGALWVAIITVHKNNAGEINSLARSGFWNFFLDKKGSSIIADPIK